MPRMDTTISCWFDYPDDPDNGRVEIRHLSDREVAEIGAQASTSRWQVNASGKLEHTFTSNPLIERRLTCAAAVQNWENFFAADGQQMPCTKENREEWSHNAAFWNFVREKRLELKALAEQLAEELRKNS